jgi:signal transduction histidine kinase
MTFNSMLAKIDRSFEQVRQFTADASHQLRTPLAAIRSVGEIALRSKKDEVVCRETIASILEEVEKMTHLVKDLLVMARFLLVAGLGLIINGIALHVALNRLAWPLAPSQMVATMLQFSAAFYSRSEAVTARTPDDAEHFFTNGTLDYFAVDAGRFAQLPKDFQTRLSEVRRINNYYLLKEKHGDIL